MVDYSGLNTTLITQLKKKIAELREEKERYSELFEQSNDAILLITLNGKIFGVNKKTEELTGYFGKELLDMHIWQLVPESEKKKAGESFKRCLKNNNERIETKCLRKDGKILNIEVSTKVVKLKEVSFIQSIIRDITERKRAEEKLIKQKEKYEKQIRELKKKK